MVREQIPERASQKLETAISPMLSAISREKTQLTEWYGHTPLERKTELLAELERMRGDT